jgi:phenylalanyl-tRNA synthetase beta chain
MRESLNRIIDNKIREILMGLGLDEIITYGLLSENLLDMSGAANNDRIKIRNPLSSEQEIMRPTLIVGMLNSMRWNLNRKTKNLRLFELGNVYIKRANNIFEERKTLSIGMTGLAHSNWAEGSRPINFFDLKGILEALLSELGVDSFILKKSNIAGLSTSVSATIKVRGESIGILGEIDHKVLANFDIKDKIHALEMNVDAIMEYVVLEKNFKALPRYPSVYRDISIIVNKDVSNEEILSSMKEVGAQILKNIELIDRYAGKQIPDGKIGLTYRFEYRDLQRTLEEKEVSAIHSRIINALETRFGGRLR